MEFEAQKIKKEIKSQVEALQWGLANHKGMQPSEQRVDLMVLYEKEPERIKTSCCSLIRFL